MGMHGSPFSAVVKVQDMLAMLGGMASLQQECALVADESGLHMHDFDVSHIALCTADYPANAMAAYDPPKERFSMGLDIKKTIQVLQRLPVNSDVGLTYEENKLVVERFKESKSGGGNIFKVTTHQEIVPNEPAYRQMTAPAEMEFEVNRNVLKNVFADVAVIFSDTPHIAIEAPSKSTVTFEAGYQYNHPQFKKVIIGMEAKITLEAPKSVSVLMEAPEQKALYSLDMLQVMLEGLIKAITVAKPAEKLDEPDERIAAGYFDTVHVTAAPGKPIRMWYYSSATDKTLTPDERLIVSHYLAGRVNN